MLQYDPEKRITAEEAIQHKYFEEIHDPDDIQLFKGKIDFDFEKYELNRTSFHIP